MTRASISTAVLAGLMGLAGATYAQTTSVPAQPDPAKGGQASTKSVPGGVANATQRPDGTDPASREAVRAEARAHNRNNVNNSVPKGEATTTVNGQPNAMPRPTGEVSRTEVSMETRKVRPRFGNPGERPEVPTNPTDRTGTPQ
ncbi:serine/threonine protein kinase [Variovorax sp. JS1663]|uniref:serine/threonine protein kinase n=1 Tax=Variovorax sp. JS1663 TaxID=1851577 RepID=UPI000B345490|nr:serine/threonine protein kinase [Variovorax sp. JS1663]OUM01471.1 serine/threonine protein kinase [Variovorax sp. JS1663]